LLRDGSAAQPIPAVGSRRVGGSVAGGSAFADHSGRAVAGWILNPLYDYDFGPHFKYADLSGAISMQPPAIRQILPSLVPKVDADGNETTGVPSVLHQAPLGTYLGWNVTAAGFFKGTGCGLGGGFVPFAKTKADRLAAEDPRPSLEERYGTHDRYVATVPGSGSAAGARPLLAPG